MKKLLLTTLLIGWFFGLRFPHPDFPTTSISVVMGPFASQAACQADMHYAKMFFALFFEGPFVEADCKEKLDT